MPFLNLKNADVFKSTFLVLLSIKENDSSLHLEIKMGVLKESVQLLDIILNLEEM